LAAAAFAAIETEQVPLQDIKGGRWTFEFKFRMPQRIVMQAAGGRQAYWVLPYTVVNTDAVAHEFVPSAVLFADTGKLSRDGIYPDVVAEVKKRYQLKALANSVEIAGELKAGEDEARDGVFVFPESELKMDQFTIFVTGLSGEFITRQIPGKQGETPKEVVLRKTLALAFDFPGDTVDIPADKVHLTSEKWIWR